MNSLIKVFVFGVLIMGCCGGKCQVAAEDLIALEPPKKELTIQFSAEWCGPCRNLKGIMKSNDMKKWLNNNEISYYHIDIDKNKDKKAKAWIDYAKPSSIPLVVKYEYDEAKKAWIEKARFMGSKSAKFMKEWIKK